MTSVQGMLSVCAAGHLADFISYTLAPKMLISHHLEMLSSFENGLGFWFFSINAPL